MGHEPIDARTRAGRVRRPGSSRVRSGRHRSRPPPREAVGSAA
ncbi:hypothetical protein ACFSM7_00875 [Clavibacter michiganensis subsp. tessellarius]